MAASQSGVFNLQEFSDLGTPLVGGRLYTYSYGTTTLKTAYTDADGLIPHTYTSDGAGGQYIALNSRGELPAPLYLTSGSYDLSLKRSDGSTVWTRRADPPMADLMTYTNPATGASEATVKTRLIEIASLKSDFKAIGNGTTDDAVAIAAAVAAINANQIDALYIPFGNYKDTSSAHTISVDGFSFFGQGGRASVFFPTTASNLFVFSKADPTTSRINDFTLADFGIDYSAVNAPAAGTAITLVRAGRARITGLDIRNVYRGIDVQGGADVRFSDIAIAGAFSWSAVQSGSCLLKFSFFNSGGTVEQPGEMFVDNFNIKGSDSTSYLERAIEVDACDGLFLTNGHCGFAYDSCLAIVAQANASASILELMCSNVYFDGNNHGNASNGAVTISGSTLPAVGGITFNACTMKIFSGCGLLANLSTLTELTVNGCTIRNNGKEAIKIVGGTGFAITGNNIRNNNSSNLGANAIDISGAATSGTITGNRIGDGANPHPNGVSWSGSSNDWTATGNNMPGTGTAFTASATARLNFKGNRKNGSAPTLASATTISIPMGFDVVEVTGTTTISNISMQNVGEYVVMLVFDGACAVSDGVGNINLAGAFTSTAGSTLTLLNTTSFGSWTEGARGIV